MLIFYDILEDAGSRFCKCMLFWKIECCPEILLLRNRRPLASALVWRSKYILHWINISIHNIFNIYFPHDMISSDKKRSDIDLWYRWLLCVFFAFKKISKPEGGSSWEVVVCQFWCRAEHGWATFPIPNFPKAIPSTVNDGTHQAAQDL